VLRVQENLPEHSAAASKLPSDFDYSIRVEFDEWHVIQAAESGPLRAADRSTCSIGIAGATSDRCSVFHGLGRGMTNQWRQLMSRWNDIP